MEWNNEELIRAEPAKEWWRHTGPAKQLTMDDINAAKDRITEGRY